MNDSHTTTSDYVPAAGRRVLTSVYDPIMAVTMRERVWRPTVLAAALENEPCDVLEVGCGTGSNAIPLAAAAPQACVVGEDGDDEVLMRARSKADKASVAVERKRGLAQRVPLDSASTDVVLMCLLLHHPKPADKQLALAEARRVLRSGGTLVVADWGKPRGLLTSIGFYAVQTLDGFETTRDHRGLPLSKIISDVYFESVRTIQHWTTPWGSLELCAANVP